MRPHVIRRWLHGSFTLIELLVVVAIIALLMAILLPAISRGKEMARRAVCAANLSQWQLVIEQYAVDNRTWYPGTWMWDLGEMMQGPHWVPNPADRLNWLDYSDTNPPGSNRRMKDYGFTLDIRLCPSVPEPRCAFGTYETGKRMMPMDLDPDETGWIYWNPNDYYGWFGRSGATAYADIYGWGVWWRVSIVTYDAGPVWKQNLPRKTNRTVLAQDKHYTENFASGQYWYVPPATGTLSNHLRPGHERYADGTNALMYDGSVTWMTLRTMYYPNGKDYYRQYVVSRDHWSGYQYWGCYDPWGLPNPWE